MYQSILNNVMESAQWPIIQGRDTHRVRVRLITSQGCLPAYQSLGHWDSLRTSSGWTLPGPFEHRSFRTQFDLISFVKTRGVQSGLMDTERPSSGLLGFFRCFREDYPQFPYAGEIAPVPQLVAE